MITQATTVLITGSRKGIGRFLAEYYLGKDCVVIGCSREPSDLVHIRYRHYCLDVVDEIAVKSMFSTIRQEHGGLDVLLNNAGIASMNHILLTPMTTVQRVLNTNIFGAFLFMREAAKLMKKKKSGRIVNFSTVACPLNLEGEAIYAASKSAVVKLTQIAAHELAEFGITVNAIGPTPIKTDLIRSVPEDKISALLQQQAIKRFGEFSDIGNVLDFFIKAESAFVTGQVIYLGGVS